MRRGRQARRALATVMVAAATILVATVQAAAAASTHPYPEQRIVERVNAERAAQKLPPMAVDAKLTSVARDWAGRMAASGELAHRPDDQLVRLAPAGWTRLGENVGRTVKWGAGEKELADRLHDAFMASQGHRSNVLGDYGYVGVGVARSGDGGMWVAVNFMRAPASSHTPLAREPVVGPQVEEAVKVSRRLFGEAGSGGRQAAFVVLGRADVFADALGGSALAGARAPILYTAGASDANRDPALHPSTRAEIDRVLGGRGTVYLLGGTGAVSKRSAHELAAAGYTVRRLAGATRVETSVAVAEEAMRVHGKSGEVLLARADAWPDAVTGGAYAAANATPVVLTPHGALHPATAAFLDRHNPPRRVALGGRAALSDEVVRRARADRIAGAERTATSVAIAERLWRRTKGSGGDRFVTAPAHGDQSWAYALAQAPWAAAHGAPQLLVGDAVPPAVADYLGRLGYHQGASADLLAASAVPAPVVRDLQLYLGR